MKFQVKTSCLNPKQGQSTYLLLQLHLSFFQKSMGQILTESGSSRQLHFFSLPFLQFSLPHIIFSLPKVNFSLHPPKFSLPTLSLLCSYIWLSKVCNLTSFWAVNFHCNLPIPPQPAYPTAANAGGCRVGGGGREGAAEGVGALTHWEDMEVGRYWSAALTPLSTRLLRAARYCPAVTPPHARMDSGGG